MYNPLGLNSFYKNYIYKYVTHTGLLLEWYVEAFLIALLNPLALAALVIR